MNTLKLTLSGRVQGVGFRPFVFQLAKIHGIKGWVCNTLGRVEIHAEGSSQGLHDFCSQLIGLAPPLSRPVVESQCQASWKGFSDFAILDSKSTGDPQIHIPPDAYLCAFCAGELASNTDRRHDYPFINCTQCGPRYTIISGMPYDRANTSMRSFGLCPPCEREYKNPENRRFHAEPNACADCGPQLSFSGPEKTVDGDTRLALTETLKALRRGDIVAVKGVGGYHLVCDAANPLSVSRLRAKKNRPRKPFALMVPEVGGDSLDAVRDLVELDSNEIADALVGPGRPIVLMKIRPGDVFDAIDAAVAPDLTELGIMLPSSPLYRILTDQFAKALVVTSGNISGEPVITDDVEAANRLAPMAECFLTHNRDILRPADDSVIRPIAGVPCLLRPGRGTAPLEYPLPIELAKPVLAVGGHMKSSVALAWNRRVVISSHIGDLSTHRSMQVFAQVVNDLQHLYQVNAELIICDNHPGYASTRWAQQQPGQVIGIGHHRAHASSLVGSTLAVDEKSLVFAWDGAGYGDDGSLWGGEAFLGSPGNWQRVASLRPFRLAGGEQAARQPWRSAAALHWQLGLDYGREDSAAIVYKAWLKGINCYDTSSMGRLFDAVASMLDLTQHASYEGEAAMRLESLAGKIETRDHLPWTDREGILQIDWAPLVSAMGDKQKSPALRASLFHAVLANTLIRVALEVRKTHDFDRLGLSGGVFQNRLLSELILDQATAWDIDVVLATQIPANDGGLSYGQVIEYSALSPEMK